MAELEDFLFRLTKVLDSIDIPYVIVGGFAAILKGSPRTTTDIDVIIQIKIEEVDGLIIAFRKEGFSVIEDQLRSAPKEGWNASIFDDTSPLRVDLKRAKQDDEFEVLNSSITEQFKGKKIKIASIEQILYGKILYLGDISDLDDNELLGYNDVRDFVHVYKKMPTIDLKWLKQKCKEKGLQETLERVLRKASE